MMLQPSELTRQADGSFEIPKLHTQLENLKNVKQAECKVCLTFLV